MAWEWYQRLPAGPGVSWKRRRPCGGTKRRTFFLRAVHLRRNQHPVPVHQFRRVGIVDHVNGDRLAFAHPQHRPRRRCRCSRSSRECASDQVPPSPARCAACSPPCSSGAPGALPFQRCAAALRPQAADRGSQPAASAMPPSFSNSRLFMVAASFTLCQHACIVSRVRNATGQGLASAP